MTTLVLLLAALALGCQTPTEPGKPCEPCGTLDIPPYSDTQAAIGTGYEQAKATCPALLPFGSLPKPQVKFTSCAFMVGHVCAAGVTESSLGYIQVSTAEPARTLPLVTYESRNWYFILGGCGNQAS